MKYLILILLCACVKENQCYIDQTEIDNLQYVYKFKPYNQNVYIKEYYHLFMDYSQRDYRGNFGKVFILPMEKSILYRKVFFFDYEKIDCPMEYKK
jgi:hypothetical protein